MERKRWVIKTNQNRYVEIPYMMGGGFKSFLSNKLLWNKTRTFDTKEEAKEFLGYYLSANRYYIDRHTFQEGEKLEGVELVAI